MGRKDGRGPARILTFRGLTQMLHVSLAAGLPTRFSSVEVPARQSCEPTGRSCGLETARPGAFLAAWGARCKGGL